MMKSHIKNNKSPKKIKERIKNKQIFTIKNLQLSILDDNDHREIN